MSAAADAERVAGGADELDWRLPARPAGVDVGDAAPVTRTGSATTRAHLPLTAFGRTYRALSLAAERVGRYQWALQHAKGVRRYVPTAGHRALVDGMADLGRERITPEQGMALLHYGEGAKELDLARAWEADRETRATCTTETSR